MNSLLSHYLGCLSANHTYKRGDSCRLAHATYWAVTAAYYEFLHMNPVDVARNNIWLFTILDLYEPEEEEDIFEYLSIGEHESSSHLAPPGCSNRDLTTMESFSFKTSLKLVRDEQQLQHFDKTHSSAFAVLDKYCRSAEPKQELVDLVHHCNKSSFDFKYMA